MKHTSNTRPASRPSRRLWVGVKGNSRTVFRHAGEPTAETHPQFSAAIGPFRTKRGAEYMAGSRNAPNCQTVRDAERLAAIHAGQSALCAAYTAHLDREIRK